MPKIKHITSHKILNSRADWTVRTVVELDDGSIGVQTVPEGASKGENEAISLPADQSVNIVNTTINDALKGYDALKQSEIDALMVEMDGTDTKSKLGGNSLLSVSLATARAAALSQNQELYEYLSLLFTGSVIAKLKFPTPLFNVINGGKHAQNNLAFQEFMVIPSQKYEFDKAIQIGMTVYKSLKTNLKKNGSITSVGDEGGFAPQGFTPNKAFSFIRDAVLENYNPGEDVFFGTDVAAESFYKDGKYIIDEESLNLNSKELVEYHSQLAKDFELIYLEDPLYEQDLEGWTLVSKQLSNKLMVVADDLVVTNHKFLDVAIKQNLANAVIVKPNQVGTLSETLKFVKDAQEAGMAIIVSHRSGDTAEDTFIADLGLGVGADFIKSGAPARGERVSKYNRLLEVFYKTHI